MATEAQCASCGEPIYWLKHDRTRKPAPIEAKTDPNGNILINLMSGVYWLASNQEKAAYGENLHLNHFVTCPQAKIWTKHGGRGTR